MSSRHCEMSSHQTQEALYMNTSPHSHGEAPQMTNSQNSTPPSQDTQEAPPEATQEAPERIWAMPSEYMGWTDGYACDLRYPEMEGKIEYVRIDLYQELALQCLAYETQACEAYEKQKTEDSGSQSID